MFSKWTGVVNYSGSQLCTGKTSQLVYYENRDYNNRNGNYSFENGVYEYVASGITQPSAFNTTRSIGTALTTSRSGYYKTGTSSKSNVYSPSDKPKNASKKTVTWQTQGGAASFSPNPIPAGRRGNVTVSVS